MAITSFSVSYSTDVLEVAKMATALNLQAKAWNELVWSFDAVQVWRVWFLEHYGELFELRHRSNPDDPPDLELIFEKEQLGLEHTAFMPYPLGYAEGIVREINPSGCVGIPSISRQWTRPELINEILGVTSEWANVSDEHNTAIDALVSSIRRKIKEPASRVVCVTDRATFGGASTEWLVSQLWSVVNAKESECYSNRIILFMNRSNNIQFFSALIQRGCPLLAYRDGESIIPRKPLFY